MGDLDRSTQQNAAMAEQCTAAATNLSRVSEKLAETVDYFDIGRSDGARLDPGVRHDLAA